MENFDIFYHHWFLNRNKIILSFEGVLSQEILVSLAEMLKQKIFSDKQMEMFAKRVFSIFIELAQNIQKYSAEKEINNGKEVGNGSIIAFDTEKFYIITSCNKIENSQVKDLKKHCEYINGLNKEELKVFYKETLKNSEIEKKISGGVGLIDIVRKTGNPINFHVIEIDEILSYVIFIVNITKEGE